MSYMILDVVVFLFIFVIVYVAFTLSIVQVYNVYSSERTGHFNTHKSAFKLFFWAMIRTGNPQFADIRVFNATKSFDKECLSSTLTTVGLWYHAFNSISCIFWKSFHEIDKDESVLKVSLSCHVST